MSIGDTAQQLVLNGPLVLAAPIALAAGALSFFSPCCLPLVPGYLALVTGTLGADTVRATERGQPRGLRGAEAGGTDATTSSGSSTGTLTRCAKVLSGQPRPGRARTMAGAGLFVLGFAAVFTSYGAAFGGLGTLLLSYQRTLTQVLGVFTIGLGLLFAGALSRLSWSSRRVQLRRRPPTGLAGAPLLGVLFGLGWAPCIGPTLAAVLLLATSAAGAWRGVALAFVYSLGLGLPFLLAAASTGRAMRAFAWPRRHARAVMRTGGLMLVLVGLLQVSGAWTALIASMQTLIGGFQLPL